jgi:heme/copper-type cytochrome/quinol oxidase subunit 2
LSLALSSAAKAEDAAYSLMLKDHRFAPAELTIPANQRVRLVVKNLDPTPAEFESKNFKAEKVVPAGREVSLTIGPLKPGTYEFYDDYHETETKGRLIVR